MRKFLFSFMVMLIPLSYASAQCNYTVNLYDSFGDGWNGNTIDIEVAGTVTNYTLSSGSTTAISVLVNSGDSIKTSFQGGGSWISECSYDVVDASGITLYTSPNGGSMTAGAVQFADTAGCPAIVPPMINSTGVTSTTATIDFTLLGVANTIEVEYGTQGFLQGGGTIVSSTTSPIVITSLSPSTDYDFYYRATDGGTTQSAWAGPISLKTSCPAIGAYPWVEDFNGANWQSSTTYDSCWVVTAPNSFRWQVNSGSTGSGSTGPNGDFTGSGKYLYTEASSSGGDALAQLPDADLTSLTQPELKFAYHMYGATINVLYIEASTDTGATWTAIDSLVGQQQASSNDAWALRIVDLDSVNTALTQIRFRAVRGSSFTGDISIDEVTLRNTPACPDPTGFAAHNITSSTADITFNVGTGASRIVEWGPTGFTAGTGTIVTSTTDSVSLSGLPAGTCVDVYIQGDCSASGDGVSTVQGPFQFCTAYVPDWIEDFNDHGTFSTWPPDGWVEMENPVGDTLITSSTGWTYDTYANQSGGSPSARENISGTFDDHAWLVGPAVDLGTGNTYNFEYDVSWTESFSSSLDAVIGSDDTVHVALSTDGGTTFQRSNIFASYHQGNPIDLAGTHVVHTLSGIDGVVHVGVYTTSSVSNESTDFFIDNIEIRTPPACQEPFGFSAITLTEDSVYFGFAADTSAVGYVIEWGPCGYAQGTGMSDTITTDTTGVGGLLPSTCYDFYVMTLCGGAQSMWAGPFNIRTLCPTYFSAPYTENFTLSSYGAADGSNSFENCWSVDVNSGLRWESEDATGANENSSATGPFYDATTPSTVGGGYMYLEASSSGTDAGLISPAIELSGLTTPTLSFAYHMYGATMGTLAVDIWNGSMWVMDVWTLSGQQQTAGSDPWLTASVPLAAFVGDTIQIRFRGNRTTTWTSDMSIDDVSVADGPNCSVVSGGFGENLTSTSADLNWSAFSSSNYDIEWGPCGFTPGTGIGTVVTGVNPGYTLSGLLPNTCYEFYVTNNCDPNGTQYGPYSFLTLCSAMLSGTYTVGGTPGPNNFADLDSVEATLVCGVSGPVTFQLMGTDTLNNAFEIFGDVMGISSTNTITFDGMGQTGTIIRTGSGPVFDLVDTRHIHFSNLTVIDSAVTDVIGIRMSGDVDSISITDNNFIVGPLTTNFNSAVVAVTATTTSVSSSGSDADHITITGNRIEGGYYGVTAYGGNTTTYADNITISDNEFINNYFYAARVGYYTNVDFNDNTVNGLRNSSSYAFYALWSDNVNVERNQAIAGTYTLWLSSMNRLDGNAQTNVENNMFVCTGTSTFNAGIYTTGTSSNVNIYHNSFNSGGLGWRDFSTTNIDVRNNIFVGGNLAIDMSVAPDSATSTLDYNVLNSAGTNLVEYGSAYTDLTAIQGAFAWADQNSLEGDPIFLSPTDLHLTGALANDAGDNTVGITVDIDGDARPASGATNVDIGADEYTPLNWDAEATALFEPEAGGCGDSAVAVSVIVRNLGLNDITTLTVNANVTGAVTANLSTTFNGLIPSTESDTISVGTFNIYTGGTVTVSGNVVLANDGDNSNDSTASRTLDYISFEPQAMPTDTVCEGSNIDLYAMTQSGVIHGWYANQADTVPVSTGDTLSVVADPAQTTYYLGYITSGLDSIETTFAANNGCGAGNMFDLALSKAIIMEGLTVHCATGAGSTETFDIYYVSGSYVGNETNQAAWTLHESVTVTSNGNGTPTPLEFTTPLTLPAGTYGIYVDGNVRYTNGSQVFSNSDMTITTGAGICTSFSSPINGRIWNGRIIYRASNACSQDKIAVTYGIRPAPTAAFTSNYTGGNGSGLYDFDASASADADSLYWMFGDTASSTANGVNTSFTYADNGTYTVTLIAFNDCGSDTITDTVSVEGIGLNELAGLRDIRLFPNPSTGNVNVLIDLSNAQDLTLEVINLQGQTLYTEGLGRVEGEYIWSADLSELPKGAYFVRLTGDQGIKNIPLTLH